MPANFGAANGNDADPDHIIDRQYGGTNLPDNIQLLDAGWNRQVGWYLGELNRALAREILDHYYPNRATRPSTIALRFDGIEVRGNPAQAAVPTDNPSRYTWAYCQANVCNGRARAVWEADLCARAMPASEVQTISHGAGVSSTPSPPATGTAQYTVRTPLATASFVTEARHTSSEKLDKPITGSAQDLIAGFILKTITLRSGTAIARGTKDRVVAELGTRPVSGRGASTAAPGVSEAAAENPPPTVQFTRDTEQLAATAPNEVGRLRLLRPGREVVRFHYPYLSNATLNLTQDSSGVVSGTGTLTPSIPLLNRAPLQLAFGPNLLRAFYGARPQNMRSPIPGFRFTEATLGVQLAPEFRPAGVIAFEVGPPRRPFLTGRVDASADQSGLVFTGTIDAHIPNTDVAHGRLAYRNHQWSGYIEVVSSQIHIPGVRRGQVRIDFNPDGSVVPSGEVFILAGASEARLGVAYRGGRFRFAGEGRFTLPGLEPIDARLESDGEHLTARAQTTVRIRGLRGTVSVNYRDGRWSGEGALPFSAGRANGNVTVRLNENGRVTGQGTLTYPITDRLTATIGVLLREDQSLHVNGEVRLADLELFQRFPRSGGRQRLSRVAPPDFPIYALPLGPFGSVGLAARVSLELGVNYGIGPGMLRNIRGTTAFDLFAENANFEFEAGAQLFIPFNAGFYLEVDGSVVLGLGPIAEVNGGIVVRGEAGLRGDFTAETRLQYRQAKFILDARAALQAHPELILSIAAFVRASALGLYETQRRWTLASFRFGSGRNFGLAFPFHYDSALGFTAPSFGAIEWIYPRDLSPRAMLGRLIS